MHASECDGQKWLQEIGMRNEVSVGYYLAATPNDDSNTTRWWEDASYAVHLNMHRDTRPTMTFGKRSTVRPSTKQKINTWSSTKSKLVGADDTMTPVLWTRYFLEEQGFTVDNNIMFKDNMSTMLLENNGKRSSTKRKKHISIQYFYITERIKKRYLSVVYCPTNEMVAYFFTKALQGALFIKFCGLIMGVTKQDIP